MKRELRTFPDDWSEMPLEEVLENLQYLLENYKKYSVSLEDYERLKIDNVDMLPLVPCPKVNNKELYYYKGGLDEEIIHKMAELYKKCEFYCLPFGRKVHNVLDRKTLGRSNKAWLVGIAFWVLVVGSVYGASSWYFSRRSKKAAIEKQVQEHAKALPAYKDYLKVAAEIERYRDSLKMAGKKRVR